MKHPLWNNRSETLRRETLCFFLGHKWKHTPRVTTEYYGDEHDKAPYGLRKATGNAMFRDVAWWAAKCTRCRHKLPGAMVDIPEVWYTGVWRGLKAGWTMGFWWHLKSNLEYNKNNRVNGRASYPWWVEALTFPMALNSGFAQFGLYTLWKWSIPGSWWIWTFDLEHWYYKVHDKYKVNNK